MKLLERESEIAAVATAIQSARDGNGTTLVLQGPAGIGKTSVLDVARRLARESGMQVLGAIGEPLEQDLPHGVTRQLLGPAVHRLTAAQREELFAGSAGPAGAVLLPLAGAGDAPPLVDRRESIVNALYWVVAGLAARGPLLMAVDDLHWSDAISLRFLAYLTRRSTDLPVVTVICTRPGETPLTQRLLDEVSGHAGVVSLRLAPLTAPGVSELALQRLGAKPEAAFVDACRDATGGIPFLLNELLAELATAGVSPDAEGAAAALSVASDRVNTSILVRLWQLSATAIAVAQAVAVLGRRANVRRVAALCGIDEREALLDSDILAAANVLKPGLPMAFVHPLVAASIYEEIPAGQRSVLHAAAAQMLRAEGAAPAEIATHLMATDAGTIDVVEGLHGAARDALERGAPASAVAYLRRARTHEPPATVAAAIVYDLARAEAAIGDPHALQDYQEALLRETDPALRAHISLGLVQVLSAMGRWQDALDRVAEALEAGTGDAATTTHLQLFRAAILSNSQEHVALFESERDAFGVLAEADSPQAGMLSCLLACHDLRHIAPEQEIRRLIDRGIEIVLGSREAIDLWGVCVGTLVGLGDLDRGLEVAETLRARASETSSPQSYLTASVACAMAQVRRGDLRAAEADLRSAFECAQQFAIESAFSVQSLVLFCGDVLVERPGTGDIRAWLDECARGLERSDTLSAAWMHEGRARMRLAEGDQAGAVTDLRACGAAMDALNVIHPGLTAWRSLLARALPAEQQEEALRLVDEELDLAGRAGSLRAEGIARVAQALCGPEG